MPQHCYPATFRHSSVLTTMTFSLVSATRIANRVVDPSFQLRDRYREELEKLDSPQKWVLVREVSTIIRWWGIGTHQVSIGAIPAVVHDPGPGIATPQHILLGVHRFFLSCQKHLLSNKRAMYSQYLYEYDRCILTGYDVNKYLPQTWGICRERILRKSSICCSSTKRDY